MKYVIILFFFYSSSFSQITNFSSKTYYHNLNHDISYSYVFVVDKNKIKSSEILSTVKVTTLDDSLVYQNISKLVIPANSEQNLFPIEETLPINLLNAEYKLEHYVNYGLTEKSLYTEDIKFNDKNYSELYLFSGKSSQQNDKYVELNGTYYKPNHNAQFVMGKNNAMYWYIEFYNLELESDTVHIKYTIFDNAGNSVKTINSAFIVPEPTFFDDGVYNVIAKLKNGSYRLNVSMDVNKDTQINENSYFTVIKSTSKKKNIDYVKYEVDHYYVLDKLESDEKEFYRKLGKEKQIEYIAAYFNKLSKVQGISIKKIRARIDQLADFIQVNYGNQSFNPYRLDVAYLLFKYGPPSSRQLMTSDPELLDYEIWEYDRLKNGVKFYLSNYKNNGTKIIHCDDPSFGYTNRNWKRLLRKI